MFEYGGQSNFNERFDFFEWSALYYERPQEVCEALLKMNLLGKKLKAVNAIGACEHIGGNSGTILYETITNAGITLDEGWWERYPHMDNVLVPWKFTLCEPIQFVFDDGDTVEILPFEGGGARIGKNSIPAGMVDGINDSGIDASEFFKELLGKELRDIEIIIRTEEEQSLDRYARTYEKVNAYTRKKYTIRFRFQYPYELEITRDLGSWYVVCARGDWRHERIPYKRVKTACKMPYDYEEAIIIGDGGGGSFGIFGFNSEGVQPALDCFRISIDEYAVSAYLSEFLYKYFDPAIQKREEFEEDCFDWYGGNRYSFETVRVMLEDIRHVIVLLQEDYNNPSLAKIKSKWDYHKYTNKRNDEISEEEANELRRKKVPNAVSFYKRFCNHMDNMLKIPGNDMITFVGP